MGPFILRSFLAFSVGPQKSAVGWGHIPHPPHWAGAKVGNLGAGRGDRQGTVAAPASSMWGGGGMAGGAEGPRSPTSLRPAQHCLAGGGKVSPAEPDAFSICLGAQGAREVQTSRPRGWTWTAGSIWLMPRWGRSRGCRCPKSSGSPLPL